MRLTLSAPCSSRILSNFKPFFNATAVQRLLDAGAVPIAKTVMDEFGMGSFTLNRNGSLSSNPSSCSNIFSLNICKVRSAPIPVILPKLLAAAVVAVPLRLQILSSALLLVVIRVAVYDFLPHIAMLLDSSPAMEASVATA